MSTDERPAFDRSTSPLVGFDSALQCAVSMGDDAGGRLAPLGATVPPLAALSGAPGRGGVRYRSAIEAGRAAMCLRRSAHGEVAC